MKIFKKIVILSMVFFLTVSFVACGQKQANKTNPTVSGIDFTQKVPDTGFFVYFNMAREDTKAIQDLQKKLIDSGVMPSISSENNQSEILKQLQAVMDKYSDITKGEYGVIAVDMKKVKQLEDEEVDTLGPTTGVYMVFVANFTKAVDVKDYLSDIKATVEELTQGEDEGEQIVVDPDKGTMTIKPEDGNLTIVLYFEKDGKNIVVSLGIPFSKMEKVSNPIANNDFWKEAASHSFAFYLDPAQIPDEKTRNEMINAGWSKPLRLLGDITSSQKDNTYMSSFVLTIYNPTAKTFDNLGIPGTVKVLEGADVILALDTDLLVNVANMSAEAGGEIGQYEQFVNMLSGGVITLSGALKSEQQMAGAIVGQYFKDPSAIWGLLSPNLQYLQPLQKSEKTSDGFEVVIGTMEPDLVDENIEESPVLYLKLNIALSKWAIILNNIDSEAAQYISEYAKVVKDAQIILKVIYDKDKNWIKGDISSVIHTTK